MAEEKGPSLRSVGVIRDILQQRVGSRMGSIRRYILWAKIYRRHRAIEEEGKAVPQLPKRRPRSVELQRKEEMWALRGGARQERLSAKLNRTMRRL